MRSVGPQSHPTPFTQDPPSRGSSSWGLPRALFLIHPSWPRSSCGPQGSLSCLVPKAPLLASAPAWLLMPTLHPGCCLQLLCSSEPGRRPEGSGGLCAGPAFSLRVCTSS